MAKVTMVSKTVFTLVNGVTYTGSASVEIPLPDMTDFASGVLYFTAANMPEGTGFSVELLVQDPVTGNTAGVSGASVDNTSSTTATVFNQSITAQLSGTTYQLVYSVDPNRTAPDGAVVTAVWVASP